MKKLTCRDLGGPCDAEIIGSSFEEIGNNCKTHVMEMITDGDEAHENAANMMSRVSPQDQAAMIAGYKKKYDAAPEI